MSLELNAQTVKWFKLPDEQLDPLMSLGALTLSGKRRFHCCSSWTLKCRLSAAPSLHDCMCVCESTGSVLGLEMVVVLVLLVVMVWMGSYLDERSVAGMDGREGQVYPRASSKEDRMRETRRTEKKEDIASPPFSPLQGHSDSS